MSWRRRAWSSAVFATLAAATLAPLPAAAAGSRLDRPVVGALGATRTTAELRSMPKPAGFRVSTAPARLGPTSKAVGEASVSAGDAGRSVAAPRAAVSNVTSFDGPTLESDVFPPDTQGDVGPTQFVVMLNTRVRSYDKLTGQPDGGIDVVSDVFWAPAMTPVGGGGCNFASDPHIRYDRLTRRWIAAMIDVPNCDGTQSNRIMIAVSDGDTISPSTVWTFFHIDSTAGEFSDYPTLGVDANALYIGTNQFATSNGSFVNSNGYVVRKSSILGSGSIVYTPFAHLIAGATGPFTPQGVDDPNPGIDVGYFIGVDFGMFGKLDLMRVTDPGGTPSISSVLGLTVPSTTFPMTVPHLGNTGGANGRLDALDDRLFAATTTPDGQIWTAHNIEVNAAGVASASGGRDGSRWYDIDPDGGFGSTPSLLQSGTVFDPATTSPNSYWVPTVAVSGQRVMVIAGSTAGATTHADAWFAARTQFDPAGTVGAPTTYTSSTFAYNPPGDDGSSAGARRWGDYSLTRVDPQDDQTIWAIQEYVQADDTWGVRIARLSAPGPATPISTSRPVPLGRSSFHVTLSGESVGGSGWYDPGSGFPDRLDVKVGCGVKVSGVGFVSPATLDLDLDSTAAKGGTCKVTTTNPDGQTSAASVLTTTKFRPDGSIRGGRSTPYVGNDVYNLRAKHQTARVDVRRGVGRTFYIRVQNDGNVPDRILVKGPGSRSGCTARYYFGNVEVTSEIVSGTYRTWLLSPGDRQTLRLRVNVAGDALADAKHSWRVVTSSVHDPLKRDAVKAIVKVV